MCLLIWDGERLGETQALQARRGTFWERGDGGNVLLAWEGQNQEDVALEGGEILS